MRATRVVQVGLDFDNTIVSYDEAFREAAIEQGLLPGDFAPASKRVIRDTIRRLKDGNWEWTKLQAYVYGPGIQSARLFDGVAEFIAAARAQSVSVCVISHKTRFAAADPDGADLRTAALGFLEASGLLNGLLGREQVYFEDTLEEKLSRIEQLRCTHFIDDLDEVLLHPLFPTTVERVLFNAGERTQRCDLRGFSSWRDIQRELLGVAV